jgi:thioredoxin 1
MIFTITAESFHREILENELLCLAAFKTDWIGTCHVMAPILEALSIQFEGAIKIVTIDAEAHRELVETYGVSEIPSFLFFKHGRLVDKITGSISKKALAASIQSLLEQLN